MAAGAETFHGTAIALGGTAALIIGPSGTGKSDLALRCIALAPSALIPEEAVLVSDDRVHLLPHGHGLQVEAPEVIRGRLEVRGQGILTVPFTPSARLVLIAELVSPQEVERFPDPAPEHLYAGVKLPVLRLAPFEASAAIKLLLAIRRAAR